MEINPGKGLVDLLRDPGVCGIGENDGTFKRIIVATVLNLDIASVADADGGGVDATVAGVALGDIVLGVAANVDIGDDAVLCGTVTATDTVRITLINHSAGAVDLAATVDFNIAVLDVT
jgi:hypothetical protein